MKNIKFSDIIVPTILIAMIFIFDSGIIKLFTAKDLLGYHDFSFYSRAAEHSVEKNSFLLIPSGYLGYIIVVYLLLKIFSLSSIQAMHITIGIYIIINILMLYLILKAIYKNYLITLMGILIFFSFHTTSVMYAVRGLVGMLCAQFFILISIYSLYKIIDEEKTFRNYLLFCIGIFMAIMTHPAIGTFNFISCLLFVIYLKLKKEHTFSNALFIGFILSGIIPIIIHMRNYLTVYEWYGLSLIKYIPILLVYLVILFTIIFLIIFIIKKLKINIAYKIPLQLFFFLWLLVMALLLSNKVTLVRTEYYLMFVMSILLLFPFKMIMLVDKISIGNYYLFLNSKLRRKLFIVCSLLAFIIILPKIIYVYSNKFIPVPACNSEQFEASKWMAKNISTGSSVKIINYSNLSTSLGNYQVALTNFSKWTDFDNFVQEMGLKYFKFIEQQLSPQTIEELTTFLAVNNYIMNLYKKHISGYYIYEWDNSFPNPDYLFIVGTLPEKVNEYLQLYLPIVYKNKTITIYEYGKHSKKDPILKRNLTFNKFKNLIKNDSLMWQPIVTEVSYNANKEIGNGGLYINLQSSNSQGYLEYSIADYKKYKGKLLTLWALVKRHNACTTYISLDDGVLLTNSKLSNFALGYSEVFPNRHAFLTV